MVSQMTPYLPCHDGFRLIPANLLRHLSERNEMHLLAVADASESDGQRQWARTYCRTMELFQADRPRRLGARLAGLIRPLSSALIERVRSRVRDLKPDVVHLEGPAMAPLGAFVRFGAASILSGHDCLSLRYRQFAEFSRSLRYRAYWTIRGIAARRFERQWYGQPDRIVVTSPSDLEALARTVPRDRLTVIPNGVDLSYWNYGPDSQRGKLVFTGNMSWPPNEDGAEYFALQVFPIVRRQVPAAEFWIVGAEPSPRVRALSEVPGVRVTGTVPDLREYLRSASVYVSPLRFGAGVKNKILEAMAIGAPIVATLKSLTGMDLENGRHALVAESPAEMAGAVLTLLGDERMRRALSEHARDHVDHHHSWDRIAGTFEALYHRNGTSDRQPSGAPKEEPASSAATDDR